MLGASQALERALSLNDDSTLSEPIGRFYCPSIPHSPATLETLSVGRLMNENAGFEESPWLWLGELLSASTYDDSDRRSGVIVIYMATDRAALIAQAKEWVAENPELVRDLELDQSILEG